MKKLLTISIASALMMTSCSQSETHAPFYQYGTGAGSNGRGSSSLGMHTLRHGETLWSVAKSYNVDLRDMLDMNNFSAPFKTRAGQRIKIPAPSNYKVKKGDTLYRVSRMFDTTTTDIARLNQIKAPYKLAAGQALRLPPKHARPQMIATQSIARESASTSTSSSSGILPKSAKSAGTKIEREELKPIDVASVPAPVSDTTVQPQYTPQPAIVQSSPELDPKGRVNFIKPVGGQIISRYGPKADGLHNDGINIKANKGDMVRAAEQGVVVYQGNQIEGYGNMILVRHAGGYLTAYAHLHKTLVKKGETVKRGQTIGTVGTTGNVNAPQLHFEIRKGRNAIDPSTLIKI